MSQRYIGGVVTETINVAQPPWTGSWTQQAALQGFAGAQAPLRIANSLRFRSSASAYLNRTPSVAGNQRTWTWSGWVKLGSLSDSTFVSLGTSLGVNLRFTSNALQSNILTVGSTTSTSVYRDPSAWYHIVLSVDTTQASNNNRLRLYVNGSEVAYSANATITQNANLGANSTTLHTLGVDSRSGSPTAGTYLDGYMAEINFVDGQALTPASFGQYDANGIWQPIAYTGTYGTNGFDLSFSNGTSTTTLGNDSSGRGNNWTTNNISLTAGSTYDWMIDSPTPYPGSSYGVGNYAVLSPITPSVSTTFTPTAGNLNVTLTTQGQAISTIAATSGKWYAELVMTSGTVDTDTGFGFQPPTTYSATYCASASSLGYVYLADGRKGYNGTFTTYGNTWTLNDVIGIALDLDNGKVYWSKNGTWQASGDPVAGTNSAYTGVSGTYAFVIRNGNSATNNKAFSINFGQRPFAYTPPSGFKSLCTQNLPNVSIYNGAQYMAATTYTGTGSSVSIANTVNGVGFRPDFVWVKARSFAIDHYLTDSVRGASISLYSNLTAAESSTPNAVNAFLSNGFTTGAQAATNQSGSTFVAWQWKAGGTAVTNTAGSITSQVSANTTAGFSVVTYTGTGANATVGHGLGVAPAMIIIKGRNLVSDWVMYHSSVGNTGALFLNLTNAVSTSINYWNNTSPTSSVVSLGIAGGVNNSSSNTYVAYCFAPIAGYSAFGSYTGNGSADGPFVYTGFRPRWVLVKRSDVSGNYWRVLDTSRNTYNLSNLSLYPNDPQVEDTGGALTDILSNGFKVRSSAAGDNASGSTYIYAAFAENPFQNALAR